ncbi:universal stress protein [Sulfodiicoccus acidiphilus]|nr:universal stress protein [Sulfodiicoccus acidiphilus]
MRVFQKILVGYDGSDNGRRALQAVAELAKKFSSKVYVVEVVDEASLYATGMLPPTSVIEEMWKKAKADIDQAIASLQGIDVTGDVVSGYPPSAITDYASKVGADLIVVGSRGLSTFKRILLGSVSTAVVQESKVPVLVVK